MSDRDGETVCQECGQPIVEPATRGYALGFASVPLSMMVLVIIAYYIQIIPTHVYWLALGMLGMGLIVWARPDPHVLAWHWKNS